MSNFKPLSWGSGGALLRKFMTLIKFSRIEIWPLYNLYLPLTKNIRNFFSVLVCYCKSIAFVYCCLVAQEASGEEQGQEEADTSRPTNSPLLLISRERSGHPHHTHSKY